MSKKEPDPNPWNIYQKEMVKILENEYNGTTAYNTWKIIEDKKDLTSFIGWKTSEDYYKSEAYKAKYAHIERKKREEEIKGRKLENGNPWNKFHYEYKKKNPEAELQEIRKAYEGVQNNEKKANKKIEKKFRDSEKKKGTNKSMYKDLK